MTAAAIDVESWGISGCVVDGGRRGLGWLGVPRGGAVDLGALHLANRLVGNAPDSAGIETSGGLVLRLRRAAVIAATGAIAAIEVADGPPVGWGTPVALPAGARVRVRRLDSGCRAYLGVRGGLERRDADLLGTLGEPPAPVATSSAVPRPLPSAVRLWRGPRLGAVEDGAWQRLISTPLLVTATSRVGCRLAGVALGHADSAVLESEGIVEGAVQVPPDGCPIVMLADHPTTGGYPVVAVVDPADLWVMAQAPVGAAIRCADAERQGSR
ncbi:MAG: allophanate hydrolase subunit 2 family protein [Ilumatobacteraceae bacterium]